MDIEQLKQAISKYPLYSQDGKGTNAVVLAKASIGKWIWYILEGNDLNNNDLDLYGLVNGQELEYGYFRYLDFININNDANIQDNVKLEILPADTKLKDMLIQDNLYDTYITTYPIKNDTESNN